MKGEHTQDVFWLLHCCSNLVKKQEQFWNTVNVMQANHFFWQRGHLLISQVTANKLANRMLCTTCSFHILVTFKEKQEEIWRAEEILCCHIQSSHYLCHTQIDLKYVSRFLFNSFSKENVSPESTGYSKVLFIFRSLCPSCKRFSRCCPGSEIRKLLYSLQRCILRSKSCSHWVHCQNSHCLP